MGDYVPLGTAHAKSTHSFSARNRDSLPERRGNLSEVRVSRTQAARMAPSGDESVNDAHCLVATIDSFEDGEAAVAHAFRSRASSSFPQERPRRVRRPTRLRSQPGRLMQAASGSIADERQPQSVPLRE